MGVARESMVELPILKLYTTAIGTEAILNGLSRIGTGDFLAESS